jgi:iron complex outermembrane receptor protein
MSYFAQPTRRAYGFKTAVFAGIAAAALLPAARSHAAAAAAAQPAPAVTDVTEVIVTAQKTAQRLQDVPIVVTALGQQQLERAQVKSVSDLTVLTPGLNVTTNGTESTTIARIRGVGNVADNPGLEDAVGLYIDGVYRPRNGVSFNDLGELSDIEILKGPQGTLFGKNTIAGVIQVTTQRPSFKFGGVVEGTVQNYNGYGGSVSVTGPLIADKLAFRLYVADRQRDGYIDVAQAPGGHIPKQNDEHVFTTRDQLLWVPDSTFDLNIIVDYSKRDDHCCAALDYQNGLPAGLINSVFPGSIPDPVSPQNFTAYLNSSLIEHVIDEGISATANWRPSWLGGAKLTSITAYRVNHDNYGGEVDSTLADIVYGSPALNYTKFTQFSEELRLGGSTGRLDWQVGGFVSHEILNSGVSTQFGAQLGAYVQAVTGGSLPAFFFPAGEGAIDQYHQVEQGEALYTQATYHLTDHILLTGGLRYTWEHKTLDSNYTAVDAANTCATILQAVTESETPVPFSEYGLFSKADFGVPCLIDPAFNGLSTHQSLDEGALTGTAKIQYKLDDTKMAYASYSRGNLVGGFNLAEVTTPFGEGGAPNTSLAPQTDTSFPAEDVDAYEIGAKTAWFDKKMSVNLALFYQSYNNHQLNAFTGTQFVEFTIPKAVAEGVEGDIYWLPMRELTINAGVTYADTYYPNNHANQAALQSPGSNLYLLPGKRLTYAPLWSATFGAGYQHNFMDKLIASASVDVKYSSSYSIGSDEDPVKRQPGFALVDASIGISTADHRLSLTVFATNLFNQFYRQTAFDGVIQTLSDPPAANPALNDYYYFPGQPRFFGATVKARF